MLNVLDEFTRECLAIRVRRRLNAVDVIDVLTDLFILRGVPSHIRSDNGPEFIATAARAWIGAVGAKTACIEPGSPWENGYCESINAKLRDELLDGEIFYSLRAAQIVIESWRRHYKPASSRPSHYVVEGKRLCCSIGRCADSVRASPSATPSRIKRRPTGDPSAELRLKARWIRSMVMLWCRSTSTLFEELVQRVPPSSPD
jgi:hypothetical protein